jgi:hypothetical protein
MAAAAVVVEVVVRTKLGRQKLWSTTTWSSYYGFGAAIDVVEGSVVATLDTVSGTV